jgi:hypothetical protein
LGSATSGLVGPDLDLAAPLRPRIGDQILDLFRRKTAHGFGGLAYASDGVTSGCRSLVEGIMKLILRFKVLVAISSPQTAPLAGLVVVRC